MNVLFCTVLDINCESSSPNRIQWAECFWIKINTCTETTSLWGGTSTVCEFTYFAASLCQTKENHLCEQIFQDKQY